MDEERPAPECPNDRSALSEYDAAGVDLSLIRWFLGLLPSERLEFLEDRVNAVLQIRALNEGE